MLKTKIRLALLAVLALTLAFVPALSLNPARAQGADCLPGLDADTCTLMATAFSNSSSLTKFVMDYTIDITSGENTVKIAGNGPIDLTQVMASGAAMSASSDPSAVLNGLLMQQTITGTSVTDGKVEAGTVEFRIVDGFLYFTSSDAEDGGWQKLDLAKAVAAAQSSMSGAGGTGGMTGGMDPADAQAAGMEILGAMMSPEIQALFSDPSKFLAAEVSDGGEVEGVSTQKVTLNIKLGELLGALTSEDAAPLLAAIGKAAGLPEGQEAMITGMAMMFKPILDKSTFALSWWIDPEAAQFRGFGIDINVKVDAQTQMMMGSSSATEDVEFDLAFVVKLTNIGEDVVVEAVEDATEINVDEAMGAVPSN